VAERERLAHRGLCHLAISSIASDDAEMREEQRDAGEPVIEIEAGDRGRQSSRIDDLGHQPRAAVAVFDRQLADAVADARRCCDQNLRRRCAEISCDTHRSGRGFLRWILHRHADEPRLPLEIRYDKASPSASTRCLQGRQQWQRRRHMPAPYTIRPIVRGVDALSGCDDRPLLKLQEGIFLR
jgi:hypothetical protein